MKTRLLIIIGIITMISISVTGVYFTTDQEQVTKQDHYISPFDEESIHEFQEEYHAVITGKVIEWHGPEWYGSDWYEPEGYEPEQTSKYYYQYDVEPLAHYTPGMDEVDIYKIFGDEDNFIPVNAEVVLFGLDKDDEGLLYIVTTVILMKPQP